MTSTAPWRRMILHFSHIGLTDGRTFMEPFGGESWRGARAHRRTRPRATQQDSTAPLAPGPLGGALRGAQAALTWRPYSCQGVRIRGPSAVIATVNSKCAASELRSPRSSAYGPGMPWTTIEFGDAQIEPGKPR